jgi:acetylornithine/N-succinyldiaminopimelate aminotransferase
MLAKGDVAKYLIPGSHGSTFGGHPVACAAGLATIETVEKENLIAHTRAMAAHAANRIVELKAKHAAKIKETRQLGLMIGIDLNFPGKPVFLKCLEHGVMVNVTHDTTIRMLPAMNVTKDELDEGFNVLSKVLGEF